MNFNPAIMMQFDMQEFFSDELNFSDVVHLLHLACQEQVLEEMDALAMNKAGSNYSLPGAREIRTARMLHEERMYILGAGVGRN